MNKRTIQFKATPTHSSSENTEEQIARVCHSGDHRLATQMILNAYGSGIRHYLGTLTRDSYLAEEAYADFCMHLWTYLARFRWESSCKNWCYTIARNSLFRRHRRDRVAPGPCVPLFDEVRIHNPAPVGADDDQPLHRREELAGLLRELASSLPATERKLMELRLQRELSWAEIVDQLGGTVQGKVAHQRERARMRKRYQRAKDKIVPPLLLAAQSLQATGQLEAAR